MKYAKDRVGSLSMGQDGKKQGMSDFPPGISILTPGQVINPYLKCDAILPNVRYRSCTL